jgi:hypothetical protein
MVARAEGKTQGWESMKHHRTIVPPLTLIAGLALALPAGALASGPLLSGYGGPGAGTQTILGAALVNGGSGGSGGGSAGDSSGSSGASSSASQGGVGATASRSRGGGPSNSATGPRGRVGGTHARPGSTMASGGAGTSSRAAGANPNSSQPGLAPAASIETGSSWFSGADMLALVLAAGALAAVALATVRLTRAGHE